jgi:hypothetical protein
MWNLRFVILLLDARESMLAPSFLVALFSANKSRLSAGVGLNTT